jgi:hypothetical protein
MLLSFKTIIRRCNGMWADKSPVVGSTKSKTQGHHAVDDSHGPPPRVTRNVQTASGDNLRVSARGSRRATSSAPVVHGQSRPGVKRLGVEPALHQPNQLLPMQLPTDGDMQDEERALWFGGKRLAELT